MDHTPSFGHGITFGRTAYVAGIGAEMLDLIEQSGLSISMTGDGLVATTHEALKEYAETPEVDGGWSPKGKLCAEFLVKILIKLREANKPLGTLDDEEGPDGLEREEPIGEIIFSK